MQTVSELFGIGGSPTGSGTIGAFGHACLMGLEVELEGYHIDSDRVGNAWNVIRDNSLRNDGVEFVLRSPKQGQSLLNAITSLTQHLQERDYSISHRCSVHCHIDFRGDTLETIRKFFKLYMLLEPSLYTMSSKDRYMNIYCPGLTHATQQIVQAGCHLYREEDLPSLVGGWSKYTGINLHSLSSLGTIEIRTHKGTASEEDLVKWVRVLNYIKTSALHVEEEWLDSVEDCTELINVVFPEDLRGDMLTDNLMRFWNSVKLNRAYFNLMPQVLSKMPQRVVEDDEEPEREFDPNMLDQMINNFISQNEGE